MVLKVGFLVVFLLLFQSLEAKKKKQEPGITTQISKYTQSVGNFFSDAWDGFLALLPTTKQQPSKTKKGTKKDKIINLQNQSITKDKNTTTNKNNKNGKKTKKRKVRKTSWGLDSIVKSAKKNLNSIYNSVTEMFQMRRSKKSMGDDAGNEVPLEDISDILKDVTSEMSKEHRIKELKNS